MIYLSFGKASTKKLGYVTCTLSVTRQANTAHILKQLTQHHNNQTTEANDYILHTMYRTLRKEQLGSGNGF